MSQITCKQYNNTFNQTRHHKSISATRLPQTNSTTPNAINTTHPQQTLAKRNTSITEHWQINANNGEPNHPQTPTTNPTHSNS
eukprot:gene3561-2512_t